MCPQIQENMTKPVGKSMTAEICMPAPTFQPTAESCPAMNFHKLICIYIPLVGQSTSPCQVSAQKIKITFLGGLLCT